MTIGSKYLPLSPNIDTAIVGQCACCAATKSVNANLSSLDLPTPDWEETATAIRRHFPAGFECFCGVWFRVDSTQCSAGDEEEYKAYLTKVLDTLIKDTNLKVFMHVNCIECILADLDINVRNINEPLANIKL